jgi:hypothetical protein
VALAAAAAAAVWVLRRQHRLPDRYLPLLLLLLCLGLLPQYLIQCCCHVSQRAVSLLSHPVAHVVTSLKLYEI